MENEFYEFALVQFRYALRKAQAAGASGVQQSFFYEKIRPKWPQWRSRSDRQYGKTLAKRERRLNGY